MNNCSMTPSERAMLEKLAAETDDPLLSNAILLLLRGATLPTPVVQRILNGCAALLDGYDALRREIK